MFVTARESARYMDGSSSAAVSGRPVCQNCLQNRARMGRYQVAIAGRTLPPTPAHIDGITAPVPQSCIRVHGNLALTQNDEACSD